MLSDVTKAASLTLSEKQLDGQIAGQIALSNAGCLDEFEKVFY